MVILLHHGEVLVSAILLFQRGSIFANFLSAKSSLEPPAIFLAFLSSY
jgi:hypothetical protein